MIHRSRPVAPVFMGTTAIPLSAEEYRRRYVRQHVPHVFVTNVDDDTVRIDLAAVSGRLVSSALLLPREGILVPTTSGYQYRFTPGAYVHAPHTF